MSAEINIGLDVLTPSGRRARVERVEPSGEVVLRYQSGACDELTVTAAFLLDECVAAPKGARLATPDSECRMPTRVTRLRLRDSEADQ